MELALSLGDHASSKPSDPASHRLGLGFNTTLSIGPISTKPSNQRRHEREPEAEEAAKIHKEKQSIEEREDTITEYVQLDLLPRTPVVVSRTTPPSQISYPWPPSENGFDVNRLPAAPEEDEAAVSSSPNSAASSFQMDLSMYNRGGSISGCKRDSDGEAYYDQRAASSRASDEDDNVGNTRKKLRLTKEQSAFLEESFKEHSTLNPKQKLALAKQLSLRPRQVEVWFQNRRARTKLKQTEVDCEYLKRCCETLTEENKRLHKELQELRALKTNSNPFYMQLPATTLTMCPSCERVATNNSTPITASSATPSSSFEPTTSKAIGFPVTKPKFYPFAHTTQPHQPTPS